MQNLLSVSVTEILCRRGVIKEESLDQINFAGASMRKVREAPSNDSKVNMLAGWLRNGLSEALHHNHLKSLIFVS